VNEVLYDDFLAVLGARDTRLVLSDEDKRLDYSDLEEDFKNFFSGERLSTKAVLGIDVYQYSNYPEIPQFLIPPVIKFIYQETVRSLLDAESYLFQHSTLEQLENDFINTGDGGFQILDTPIHCVVFALYFEANCRMFTSLTVYPKLGSLIGDFGLRYAMSYEKLYRFDNNFFGPAIINNARMLSKDKLNRCLVDSNFQQWFLHRIGGVESLNIRTLIEVSKLQEFQHYSTTSPSEPNLALDGLMIAVEDYEENNLKTLDLLKIGQIRAKQTELDIFNLHLKAMVGVGGDNESTKEFIVTVGNLNTSGIDE
jgi:hypothetical protein